jgi:hypothetical protein
MNRHLIAGLLFFAGFHLLCAQNLPTEQVDVIRDFEARLIDREKFNVSPELPPLDTSARRLSYELPSRMLSVDYPPPRIRPLAMRPDANPEIFRGFVRLGGGFPNALVGETNFGIANKENFVLDLDAQHLSANNDKNLENQRFAHSHVNLDGTYYFDQGFAVRGDAKYVVDNVHFYGYNDFNTETDTFSFAKDDVHQRFTTLAFAGEFFNGERTQADFNYSAGLDVYHMQDLYAARENGLDMKLNGTKWFNGAHPLAVTIRTDFTDYRDTAKQSLNNFYLQPSFTYSGDFFRVKLGMNLASSNDEFFFFPDVEAALNLIPSVLTVFAGVEGDLQKNNFRHLANYNPFLNSRPRLRNTEYNNFFGGIRGDFFGIDYEAQASYKKANNLALFLSDEEIIPRFLTLYDTVEIYSISGAISMPLFDGFQISGSARQNFFAPKNEEKAWHLPSLTLNAGASYVTLEQRLTLRGDIFVENGVPYKGKDTDGEARNLNALLDLSLGAEYVFTNNLGAFVRLKNVLNNRRQRWHHYPVLGFNAVAGIYARF